ncbi:hypothetical protein [Cloacibacterium sp.]|uniref:hypothetical protein n=1 Tax=Cloacibacterium sp. TaxID=1913682 RepID=UPI0039E6078B
MNGKLKLKLTRRALFKNNRYEVFLDDIFIGSLDKRTPKLDYITSLGNHKIVIKSDYSVVEKHFDLNSEKPILPVGIKESYFWSPANEKLEKAIKGFLIGFLIVYAFVICFSLFFKEIQFNFTLTVPFIILVSLSSLFNKKNQFDICFN